MQRFRSILARILLGFFTILLLQMATAAVEWGSEVHLQNIADIDMASEAALAQAYALSQASLQVKAEITAFLHVGGTAEREAVAQALANIDARAAALGRVSGAEGRSLSEAASRMHTELDAVIEAVGHKRAAIDAIRDMVRHGHNTAIALVEAAGHSSNNQTATLSGVMAVTAAEPLIAALNNAIEERPLQRRIAIEAIQHADTRRDALTNYLQTRTDTPPRITRLSTTLAETVDALEPALNKIDSTVAERAKAVQALHDEMRNADGVTANLLKRLEGERKLRQDEMKSARATNRLTAVLGAVFACCVGLVLATLVGRSITRPIARLNAAMRRIADGNLEQPVPDQSRRDEVGDMANALLALRDASLRARTLEAEAEAQRDRLDAKRQQDDAARIAALAEQEMVVDGLADGLACLAGGDLACRLEQAFPATYEKLRSDFNAAMEALEATMQTIAAKATGLQSGSGEISHATDDLARRTEQQAAALEESAAALGELTATVRRTADGAKHTNLIVNQARTDAENSGEIVKRAISAMGSIENSSSQVGQIIGVIDEIAFQTNLLALNAGVEAARAGEAGRGFAVVASEVRGLAQRSAEAAREIKALIATSAQQVGTGVQLVNETGQALARIVGQIKEISGVVAEIAASAQEQATGLNEVNSAIGAMDQMTQQNAAMVEESTTASHALAEEAETLTQLTAQFQISKQPNRQRQAA
jgi:methyl-accepting chemotaxis protein